MATYELNPAGLFLPTEKAALPRSVTVSVPAYKVRAVLQSGNRIRFYEYMRVACPGDGPDGFETLASYEHGRNSCDCERMLKLWFRGDGPVEFDDVDDPCDPCTDGLVSVLSLKVSGREMLTDGPV